jgi:hypothetical protein
VSRPQREPRCGLAGPGLPRSIGLRDESGWSSFDSGGLSAGGSGPGDAAEAALDSPGRVHSVQVSGETESCVTVSQRTHPFPPPDGIQSLQGSSRERILEEWSGTAKPLFNRRNL